MAFRRAGAEFIGTFGLVFVGVGAAVIAGDKIGVLGIAFAFGLALLALAYAIGPVSGCHINPAVTLGLLVRGKVGFGEAVRYWIAQIAGAIAAAGLVYAFMDSRAGGYDAGVKGLGANGYGAHSPGLFPEGAAIGIEVLLTAVLVFVVLATTDKMAEVAFAGIPIGFALLIANLVAIPIDNASINPARSIGPAVFVGGWALDQLWVFIVAPLVGGLLGALVHAVIFSGAAPVPPEESAVVADRV